MQIRVQRRARFLDLLKESESLLNSEFQRAYARLAQAERYVNDAQTRREVDQVVVKFNRRAVHVLNEAEDSISSGDFRAGIDMLRSLSGMRLLDIAPDAQGRLQEISGNPRFGAALLESNAKWAYEEAIEPILAKADCDCEDCLTSDEPNPLDRAARLDVDDRLSLAVALKKIVEQYVETETGRKAAGLLESLSDDQELITAAEKTKTDAEVALEFQQAIVLARNGSKDRAIKQFESLLAADLPDHWKEMVERELRALGREPGR